MACPLRELLQSGRIVSYSRFMPRSAFLWRYWRSSRLVFSLVQRCQGWCGSKKDTRIDKRRGRMRTARRAGLVSDDHYADGETYWRRAPSVTACTHHGRSIRARPHQRFIGILPPQPLGDLLWRPIVIQFGGDHTRQLRIRRQLAHFRAPRPAERDSVGGQRPVDIAATVAADLPRYRRRRSIDAPGDRACRQARRDPACDLLPLDHGQMIGPPPSRNRRNPTAVAGLDAVAEIMAGPRGRVAQVGWGPGTSR